MPNKSKTPRAYGHGPAPVTRKWGRCLAFTLPDTEVVVKVVGDKDQAAQLAVRLFEHLVTYGVIAPVATKEN